MNVKQAEENSSGYNHRNNTKREMANADITNPCYKRFQKNTVCQEKRNALSGQMNWNRSPRLGRSDMRTEFRLLRSSKKDFPNSARMKGVACFNDSTDQILHLNNTAQSKCDDGWNNSITSCKFIKRGDFNEDWGRRTELHNIFNVSDGDKVWNIIRRGLFAEIKLWKNCYGMLRCKATGKISVKGIPEKSIIEINSEDNLRKLLSLSHMQWSALCEALDEKKIHLKFDAFEEVDMNKKSSLEKLWFFICKRRHFLPNVCVLGKLSGAVKVMRELHIMPKIVVTEIRDFKGEEIS